MILLPPPAAQPATTTNCAVRMEPPRNRGSSKGGKEKRETPIDLGRSLVFRSYLQLLCPSDWSGSQFRPRGIVRADLLGPRRPLGVLSLGRSSVCFSSSPLLTPPVCLLLLHHYSLPPTYPLCATLPRSLPVVAVEAAADTALLLLLPPLHRFHLLLLLLLLLLRRQHQQHRHQVPLLLRPRPPQRETDRPSDRRPSVRAPPPRQSARLLPQSEMMMMRDLWKPGRKGGREGEATTPALERTGGRALLPQRIGGRTEEGAHSYSPLPQPGRNKAGMEGGGKLVVTMERWGTMRWYARSL